jgi:L-lactate dehydrogenase complex protein LldG
VSAARDEMLRRIRTALGDGPRRMVDVPRDYRQDDDPALTAEAVVDRLEGRLIDYKARVRRVDAGAGVGDMIATALADRGVPDLVVPAGVPDEWLVGLGAIRILRDDPPLTHADLDAAAGVLTSCVVAIAETGTIVLDAGPGQGRRVLSLLPDYHLCVVRADQIVLGVPAGLRELDPLRTMTFISGPSATSDIELERVEGVHGPRTLEVVIVGAAAN